MSVFSDRLVADGWREYRDQFKKYSRNFYKRFETPTVCACNSEKFGMRVEIHVFDPIPEAAIQRESLEMSLSGELPDGIWIKIGHWAIQGGVDEALMLIPRMLAVWEFAALWKEAK